MIRTENWEVVEIEELIKYLSDRYDDLEHIAINAILAYNPNSFVRITKEVLEAYIDFVYDELSILDKRDEEKIKLLNDVKEIYYHIIWGIEQGEIPKDFLVRMLEF